MLNLMFLGTNGSMQGDEGNTSLLFKGSRGTVLVDASCGLGRAVAADVHAVVLPHEHIDHVYGLPSLIHQLWLSGRRRALDICVPAGMEEFVHRFLEVFSLQEKKNMFDFRIRTGRQFSVGSMEITLFSTEHTETSVGLVVREGEDRVVYTSDTRPIREILPCMAGAQVLIHEASGCEAEEEILWKKGHSNGADAARLAERLGVGRLYLCHLPETQELRKKVLEEASAIFPSACIPPVGKLL